MPTPKQRRETDIVSSNTLFHFTGKLGYLKSILENGAFFPRYSLENFSHFPEIFGNMGTEWAIPMVCFCDIPLSKARSHMNFYGNYGIGMSKEWGHSHCNPLIYLPPQSNLAISLSQNIQVLKLKIGSNEQQSDAEQLHESMRLIRFTKMYEGQIFRKGQYQKSVKVFYNEREWRFIPRIQANQSKFTLAEEWLPLEYYNGLKAEKKQDLIQLLHDEIIQNGMTLKLDIHQIKYILVKTETEKSTILKLIEKHFPKGKHIPTILTRRQLNEDI